VTRAISTLFASSSLILSLLLCASSAWAQEDANEVPTVLIDIVDGLDIGGQRLVPAGSAWIARTPADFESLLQELDRSFAEEIFDSADEAAFR
jgi:hypothetical protein